MIKLLMFDFDGVIDNNYELHFEVTSKEYIGITREQHRQLFEGNIHEQIEKIKHLSSGFDRRSAFSDLKMTHIIEPDVKDTLVHLSKEYTMGIITSAKEYGVHGYLKNNGIDQLFAFVYGAETAKLKDEKMERVMNEYNVSNDECVFITDTLGDVLEANKVGVRSIALDNGYHERERLQKGNPFAIISHVTELQSILDRM